MVSKGGSNLKTLTIIVDKEQGVFLGSFNSIAIFSETENFCGTKAIGFDNKEEAKNFVETYIPSIQDRVYYLNVSTNTSDSYVDVVDIIKDGHYKEAKKLFENMETEPTIH